VRTQKSLGPVASCHGTARIQGLRAALISPAHERVFGFTRAYEVLYAGKTVVSPAMGQPLLCWPILLNESLSPLPPPPTNKTPTGVMKWTTKEKKQKEFFVQVLGPPSPQPSNKKGPGPPPLVPGPPETPNSGGFPPPPFGPP